MMKLKLFITGGILRPDGFELGEGKYYGCAKLLHLDTGTARIKECLSLDQGNQNYPDIHPNLQFTAGDVDGETLWLPTDTEIRHYRYPSLDLLDSFSHPCFHNIHSVTVRGNELYVTSTGLDMVVILDKRNGSVLKYLNTEGKPAWHRFSPEIDYRRQHSTRPHDSHPNFVFWVDGEPWVTRCTQEDAVKLDDTDFRIDISGGKRPISVHDGIVRDGLVYFTTVDGAIVLADPRHGKVVDTIQISSLKGYGGLRGWCRGLHIAGNIAYVGFSRLRKTRRMEKLAWVKRMMMRGESIEECSVLAIDLSKPRIVDDYRVPKGMLDAIYTLLPEPGTA